MARGWTWGVYVDDRGEAWGVPVDRDALAQPELGWFAVANGDVRPFPRTWRMRRAIGVDPSGREHSAVIATLNADLWIGAAPGWIAETSSQGLTEVRLTRTLGEISPLPVAKPEIP
jgi:hypothetical protein